MQGYGKNVTYQTINLLSIIIKVILINQAFRLINVEFRPFGLPYVEHPEILWKQI